MSSSRWSGRFSEKREHLRGVQKAEWQSSGAMVGGNGRGEAGSRKDTRSSKDSRYRLQHSIRRAHPELRTVVTQNTYLCREGRGDSGDHSLKGPQCQRRWGYQREGEKE